jgi:ribonucleoside-diphosphate reductase alpha chain
MPARKDRPAPAKPLSEEPWIFPDTVPADLPAATLSDNARLVLARRYLKKDEEGHPVEEPETMFWRVARVIAEEDRRFGASEAAVEELARQFYHLMSTGKFEPNSPTLMNAGRPLGQLSACFVLPVDDALSNGESGIYDTLKSMALVHQSGGGTGFSFSRLRSTGDTVRSTMGVASGPVSFMKLYDASTEVVKQGGTRRGANMGILRVDHPDIREFIRCKDDTSQITNFNISVAITDAFMQAVREGSAYELKSPRTGEVVGSENAREIFDMIVHGAWKTGEPGVFFIDRANEYNPVPELGSYEATNPCVTADTWVHTDQGPRQVRELTGRPFVARLRGSDHASGPQGFFSTGVKPLVRIRTFEGYTLRLTADHRVLRAADVTRYRVAEEWCPAGELEAGDRLVLNNHRAAPAWPGERTREEGYLLGLLVGDGTLKEDGAVLSAWAERRVANGDTEGGTPDAGVLEGAEAALRTLPHRSDFAGWHSVAGRGEVRMRSAGLRDLAFTMGMTPGRGGKAVGPALETTSSDFHAGFLRGYFDADGSVQGSQARGVSIRLAQSEVASLETVQRMLLRLGIASTLYQDRRPAGEALLPDGRGGEATYATRAQHELVISNDSVGIFQERVGFGHSAKAERLATLLGSYRRTPNRERFVARVVAVEAAGEEEVFDVQVPGVNAFDANGLVAHNCGEQPLLPYDVCNLGSVNVGAFVRTDLPEGTPAEDRIDWESLRTVVHLATHFLDNVIDANRYPLPQITELAQNIRRVGLGIMGWADLLVRCGVPYSSDEGVELGRRVMGFLNEESRRASERLAETRGVFPAWEASIWGPDESCARRADGSRVRPERPLRNSNITTVAPTGTISIFAGCSGGIEPLFAVAFMRNQAGAMMPDVNADFIRIAKEQGWYSDELMERIATEGHIHFDEVPEAVQRVFVTAHDITPEWHVRMQAAFQEHTDSAISKTTNFPHEATEEEVRAIYELAYELDCKGVTVYRDGCRPMQVLSTGKTGKTEEKPAEPAGFEEAVAAAAQEANAELEQALADAREEAHRLRVEMEQLRGQYAQEDEVARAARHKRHRPEMLRGRTIKMISPLGDLYVTINEDEQGRPFEVFTTLGKAGGAANADAEAIGRLASLALRSGIPITAVRDQLRGISCDRAVGIGPNKVLSAPDAIAQAIERYLLEREGVQEELPIGPRVQGVGAVVTSSGPAAPVQGAPQGSAPVVRARTTVDPRAQETFLGTCPECGSSQLAYEEGCMKCHVCGYSECG